MNWFTQLRPKLQSLVKKREVPDNLWIKCPRCEQMLFNKEIADNLHICKHCDYHMILPIGKRVASLFDGGAYQKISTPSVAKDPLGFRDQKKYIDRLRDAQTKTLQEDAIILASGALRSMPIIVACFNFEFIGGSMGMAVGEALLLGAQKAISQSCPYIIVSSSGGARMQEGIFSLMQMVRSTIAIIKVKEKKIPFISVMAHPTTGGVAASFASLGDINISEPNAIIGFTGARVIQETIRQPLPDGFQTSEFQKEHGFVDIVVHRTKISECIADVVSMLRPNKI